MTDILTQPTAGDTTPALPTSPVQLATGWWVRGLNLAERRGLPGGPPAATADDQAARRLRRWRESYQLGETGQFDRRLAEIGMTEAELLALLGEDPADLAGRVAARPAWAEITEAVLARVGETKTDPEPPSGPDLPWQTGFTVIVSPFMGHGLDLLAAAVTDEGMDELVDVDGLRGNFVSSLGQNLNMLAARTLVLELNVLRVTGRLDGDTPQQRYWDFVRHFSQQPQLAALFDEYPVLARLLAQGTGHAVENWLELLRRYTADRAAIVTQIFGGADPGRLVAVTAGRGDSHERGRTVAILRFASGAQLVYKPRPLAAHRHFNEAVDWLNRQDADLGLRTLVVFDRGRYGWVEFADHEPCEDRAAVELYHRRQGALLGLLYALDGWDFHFENIIASGDQPVLVDLEALFHPRLPVTGPELLTGDPAMSAFDKSVSTVGLLPMLVFGDGGVTIDLSGNGGDAGRPMPFKDPGWAAAGTDEMRLIREHHPFPGSQNRVRLGDADVDACEFADVFVAGFRAAYDAIVAGREELAALLERFAGDELRVVVRPTRAYGTLLYESTHPDALRDALDRDRVLDYLWAISANNPACERVVEHERADLWAGDIPFFTTRPESRDVWTSVNVQLPELLAHHGLERSAQKIAEMGPHDRGVQEWIISASFVTRRAAATGIRELEPGADRGREVRGPVTPAETVDPQRALDAARAVGDLLADSAYEARGRVGWLGLDFVENTRWTVQPLRYDLYSGYPGIAIFLSQLAELTGEERYAALAHRTLAPVGELAEEVGGPDDAYAGCGAFTSLAGMAYALVHVAANLGDPDLLAAVEPIVTALPSAVATDEVLDVIGGSAGQLVAMLAIYEATGLPAALQVARLCADRLVESARPADPGLAWHTTITATQPLTGFSHGVAGIGWALLRYAAFSGEQRYAEVGLDAFRYERSLYGPEAANWPDFRILDGAPPAQPQVDLHAWCHGSPGVGLARAGSGHVAHPEVAADLDLAVQAMLLASPATNLSLCHGQLGNLELLTLAAEQGRPDLLARRAAWGGMALAEFDRLGPVCGTPSGISTPGLMTGLAGIGHGLLRLGFPERVPSLLLLQAPGRRTC